jgi:hypothetical protein
VRSAVSAKIKRPSSRATAHRCTGAQSCPRSAVWVQFGVILDDRAGRGLSELSLDQHPGTHSQVSGLRFLVAFLGHACRSPSVLFAEHKHDPTVSVERRERADRGVDMGDDFSSRRFRQSVRGNRESRAQGRERTSAKRGSS